MKKRSQVTLFVILGLVVLFSTLIVLYIRSQSIDNPLIEFQDDPVTAYIEHCLGQIAEDALVNIGQQGGFIEIEADQTADLLPFESPFFSYSKQLYIPYWFYQRNGLEKTEMPQLHKSYDGDYSIQWQLEDYINRHLGDCVDLSALEAQGIDVAEMGVLETSVIIAEENVNFKLNYPLKIYENDDTETRSDYFTDVSVRLGRVYRLAKEIRDYEMETVFLERNTKNLITLYSRIDNDYLPPMYGGLQFEPCSRQVNWIYQDVEADFKEMLTANIPFLHIDNTDFEPIVVQGNDQSIRQGIYNNMVHHVSDNYYSFIRADFEYMDSFPLELDLGTQGLLQPLSYEMDLVFSFICMFEYQFPYSIKYPVLITLTDSKSRINNRDYVFQFPMVVVLKNNHPRIKYQDAFGEISLPEVSSECDPEYRLSAPMTVNVLDIDKNGIDEAEIIFQCGPSIVYDYHENGSIKNVSTFADACYIGSTDDGFLTEQFPQCSGGGMMTIRAPDHVQITEIVGDTMSESRTFEFELDKVYEKPISVRKIFVKPPSITENPGVVVDGDDVSECNIFSEPNKLQSYEHALVRLVKTDNENGELRTPSVAFYNPANQSTIFIAPGTYDIDIMLFRNERYNGEMTIFKDSESRTIPGSIVSEEKIIRYPEEDVLLPSTISGGAFYSWTVTAEDLESASEIEFMVFDEGMPKILEDIGMAVSHREKCSEYNYEMIKPRLK